MGEENILRRKARKAILSGKLPERLPDRTWGGPGAGDCCTICDAPIEADELELEIEFARGFGRDRHHVHIRCFAAWDFELRQLKRTGETIFPGERPRPAVAGRGGPPERSRDSTVSGHVLPGTASDGNIDGHGDQSRKRGSG